MKIAAEDFDIMDIAFKTRLLQLIAFGNMKHLCDGKEEVTLEILCNKYIHLDTGNLATEIVNGLIASYKVPDSLTQVDDFDLYDSILIYLTEELSNPEYVMSEDLKKVMEALPNIK